MNVALFNQAKPCLANQANPRFSVHHAPSATSNLPKSPGLDAVQHNDMCHHAAL